MKHTRAIFSNIPIQYLEQVQATFRANLKTSVQLAHVKRVHYRFRGPRSTRWQKMTRSAYQRQSYCLKATATTFSVYIQEYR